VILRAVPEEEYCVKSQIHSSAREGNVIFCYRCMMVLGTSPEPRLGSLLDF
jgi:hypothetical protein